MAFRDQNVFGTFEKRAPVPDTTSALLVVLKYYPILHNVFLLLGLSMLVLVLFFLRVLFPAPTFLLDVRGIAL